MRACDQCSIFSMVHPGFYWNYTLLLQLPVLMCSCVSYSIYHPWLKLVYQFLGETAGSTHTHTHTHTEQRCLWFKRLLNYNRMHVCLLLFCMGASCTQRIKNLSTTGRWVNFLQHCYSVYRCIAIRCTVECQLFEHVRTEPRLVTMNIP